VLLTYLNVLAHLVSLNVAAEFLLEVDDFDFQEAYLLHQVLVELVLVNLAALLGKQLHFLLDEGEDQNLLVLVQHAVATLVEHIDELLGRA
jgi:hypothetical protein